MYMFVTWFGERREFATQAEAEKAAFEHCIEIVSGKYVERLGGHSPTSLTLNLFETGGHIVEDGGQHAGCVTVSRDGYPAVFRSWSPASFGHGGAPIDLSPEEYAMVLGHRRKWSAI